VSDITKAQSISQHRQMLSRQATLLQTTKRGIEALGESEVKELLVIIKADVQGSVEVLKSTLQKLSTERVKVKVIRSGVGAITESDVLLGSATQAGSSSSAVVIIGFNVRPEARAADVAKKALEPLFEITFTAEQEKALGDLLGPINGRENWEDIVEFMSGRRPSTCPSDLRHAPGTAKIFAIIYQGVDAVRKIRLAAPEYAGDGKTPVTDSKYAKPIAVFHPLRPATLDLTFYNGTKFPARYRNGAFLAMHGGNDPEPVAGGRNGYNVMFVPFSGGRAGKPEAFAEGFAGPGPKNIKSAPYRPVGVSVGPDGALYVAESNKGKIWRISYGESGN
jgi:hypothetical protein